MALICVLSVSVASAAYASSIQDSYSINSSGTVYYGTRPITRLHTDGKYIKNDYGQIIYLRGASTQDFNIVPRWGADGDIEHRINALTSVVGKNKITLILAYIHYKWTGADFTEAVGHMDELKDVAIANNMYFMIKCDNDGNVAPLVADQASYINWLKFWINRYRDVPNFAGFDVFNEPRYDSQATARSFNTNIYNAIYAADPTLLVAVESQYYNYISTDYINNPLGPQVIYAFDNYFSNLGNYYRQPYIDNNFELGKQRLEALFRSWGVDASDIPVMNNEFGFGELHSPWGYGDLTVAQNLQASKDWFALLNQYNTNWSMYCLWPQNGNSEGFGMVQTSAFNDLTSYTIVWSNSLTGYS